MHHQWTWRESFLLLTNSVSQQWLPVHQNYIIFFTFPVHRFHDAVMVFASLVKLQVHILESPLHGKKTWGAQWFVQSSQGCQSNGFDGSPFHTSPWCTTPSNNIFYLWWRNASLPSSLQHWKHMLCRKGLGHRGLLCLPSFPHQQISWKLIWNWETGEDMELEINWKGFETGLAVPSRPLASAHKPSPAICRYLETYLEK